MNCSNIDWNLLFDILKSISIIIASIVAILGINSWRKETRWRRKYELAEQVLGLFYQAKEGIEIARFPGSYTSEGSSRGIDENEDEDETTKLNTAYVPIERLNKISETFNELSVLKFPFIAVFEEKASEPFNELFKIKREIEFAANMLSSRYWNKHHLKKISRMPKRNQEFEYEQIEKFEKVIWASNIEKDEINNRLKKVMNDIEELCRKILSK